MVTTREYVRAEGDVISIISERVVRQVSYADFISNLQSTKISTPILPHGTIWYESSGVDKLYALQLPPKKRVVPYNEKFYTIGFPSLVIVIKVSGTMVVNVALAVAKKPVVSFEDALFRVPLPNMDDRGVLCLGYEFSLENNQYKTEVERIAGAVSYIESSKYNNHLLPIVKWIPTELRGDYAYRSQQLGGPEELQLAESELHNVLSKWQELTSTDNWLQALDDMDWILFRTFSEFIHGGM